MHAVCLVFDSYDECAGLGTSLFFPLFVGWRSWIYFFFFYLIYPNSSECTQLSLVISITTTQSVFHIGIINMKKFVTKLSLSLERSRRPRDDLECMYTTTTHPGV